MLLRELEKYCFNQILQRKRKMKFFFLGKAVVNRELIQHLPNSRVAP